MRRPVILDADPGVDDALAMMLALGSRELEVLGICTVCGNVPMEVGTGNALKLLALLNRDDVPVYAGACRPLKRKAVYATEVHGKGGLGDAVLPPAGRPSSGDAVAFIVDTLSARPGRVTLIAVGPLTNLALAESRSPGVLKKAREVCVMGGAIDEPGNVTPAAEFNFFADPDAARQVVALRRNHYACAAGRDPSRGAGRCAYGRHAGNARGQLCERRGETGHGSCDASAGPASFFPARSVGGRAGDRSVVLQNRDGACGRGVGGRSHRGAGGGGPAVVLQGGRPDGTAAEVRAGRGRRSVSDVIPVPDFPGSLISEGVPA